jgi:hypothetical protein
MQPRKISGNLEQKRTEAHIYILEQSGIPDFTTNRSKNLWPHSNDCFFSVRRTCDLEEQKDRWKKKEAHRLREDPFHNELRRGRGREGEGATSGRPGVGGREGASVVELARGVLGYGADERGRRRRRRRWPERAAGCAPGAGEELERIERRLRRPELAGGAGPRIAHARVGGGVKEGGRSDD